MECLYLYFEICTIKQLLDKIVNCDVCASLFLGLAVSMSQSESVNSAPTLYN